MTKIYIIIASLKIAFPKSRQKKHWRIRYIIFLVYTHSFNWYAEMSFLMCEFTSVTEAFDKLMVLLFPVTDLNSEKNEYSIFIFQL